MRGDAFQASTNRHASANPRLYDIIRESRAARHGVRRDPMIEHKPGCNLPTPWLRTQSAERITLKREIVGGRQTIRTIGFDASRNAPTWETSTVWHDAQPSISSEHATMTEAVAAADREAKR
jgi:hypothetical protein